LDEQSKKADRCPEVVANGKKQETGNKIMNGLRATVIMPISVKNKEVTMPGYVIRNKGGRYLTGFYPNGGWELKSVFVFSRRSWYSFDTMSKARSFITQMIKECEKQKDRWGDWTEKALKYIRTFRVESGQVIH